MILIVELWCMGRYKWLVCGWFGNLYGSDFDIIVCIWNIFVIVLILIVG